MPTSSANPTQQLLTNLHKAFVYEKILRQHQESSDPRVVELFQDLNEIFSSIYNLLKQEIEFNVFDKENKTVLFYAVLLEKPEVLEQLLAKGVNPHMIVEKGKGYIRTALDLAVINSRSEIITILLEKRTTPNFKDKKNDTPLHCAVKSWRCNLATKESKLEVVSRLLAGGVPCAAVNKAGETALDLALHQAQPEIELCKILIQSYLLEDPKIPKTSLLENSQLTNFWNDCQKMSSSLSQKISATNYSLGDFIKERNIEKLAAMCRNENIVSAVELKITDCLKQFPYYAKHLKSGLENGLSRKLAIERGLIGIDICKEVTISKNIFEKLTPYLPTKSIQAFHIAINPSVFFQIYKKPDSSSVTSEITYLPNPIR